MSKNVGELLFIVVVGGTAVGEVVSLFQGFTFGVGIHGDVGKVGVGFDGFKVGKMIAIQIWFLGTSFQILLVTDVLLGSSRFGRSVGEGDGNIGGIRLGTYVVGAADSKDGGRINGTVLGSLFLGIFVGDQGCVERCVPIGMDCLGFFVGGNV